MTIFSIQLRNGLYKWILASSLAKVNEWLESKKYRLSYGPNELPYKGTHGVDITLHDNGEVTKHDRADWDNWPPKKNK